MDVREAVRVTRQWTPFIARTVAYGTVSLTLGPLTRDRRVSLWAMKAWCKSSARGLNIAVEARGLENVPPAPYVYCSNHQSLLDILVLGSVLPGDFKWAAKRELMKIPFLGWHLQLAGHVPVERGRGAQVAAQIVARFEEVLRAGKPLLVFPEGTRSEEGNVRAFKNGGFLAAVRAGVPVVPVALNGTGQLMKKGAPDTGESRERLVRVHVGRPIYALPEGTENERVIDLRNRTRAAVLDLFRDAGGHVPTDEPKAEDDAAIAAAETSANAG